MNLRRFIRQTDGATAVETALTAFPLVLLTFGIMEVGRALYTKQALNFGADRAARLLYINPAATEAQMTQTVLDNVIFADPTRLDVTLSAMPAGVSTDDFTTRQLTVTYDFISVVPSILTGTITLSTDRHVVIRGATTP